MRFDNFACTLGAEEREILLIKITNYTLQIRAQHPSIYIDKLSVKKKKTQNSEIRLEFKSETNQETSEYRSC